MPRGSRPGERRGGRRRGTPNKVTAALKDAITAAFDEVGGKDYLVQVARSDPRVFCTLLGKLIPSQVKAELETPKPTTINVVTGFHPDSGPPQE